jgi:transcriptional regulator with XRE-family HTH domain
MASRGREAAQRSKEITGVLPSHTEEAQQRRRQANRQRELERLEWETKHADEIPDVEWYLREIAPRLRDLGLTATARALGVSKSAVSKYRAGKHVPHPRHWPTLAALVTDS